MKTTSITLLLILLPIPGLTASPDYIEVFTSNEYPITYPSNDARVQILNIDLQKAEEARLSMALPSNRKAAIEEVKRRANKYSKEDLQRIWAPKILAARYQIKAVPAIVFNRGENIIYGITDISDAIQRWEKNHAK